MPWIDPPTAQVPYELVEPAFEPFDGVTMSHCEGDEVVDEHHEVGLAGTRPSRQTAVADQDGQVRWIAPAPGSGAPQPHVYDAA